MTAAGPMADQPQGYVLRIFCPRGTDVPLLSDTLLELGAVAVDQPVPAEAPPPQASHGRGRAPQGSSVACTVTARFPGDGALPTAELMEIASAAAGSATVLQYGIEEVDAVAEAADWMRAVQQEWPPTLLTSRIAVRFPWHSTEAVAALGMGIPPTVVISLEGGEAFGSGEHATTALCANWLEQQVFLLSSEGAQPKVFDYGCGAGLLAMVAKLTAPIVHVAALDSDARALSAARRNAALNHVTDIAFYRPPTGASGAAQWADTAAQCEDAADIPELPVNSTGQYDIVVANLSAVTLMALKDSLVGLLRPGGLIGLCGITLSQEAEVCEAYEVEVPTIGVVAAAGQWALVAGVREN